MTVKFMSYVVVCAIFLNQIQSKGIHQNKLEVVVSFKCYVHSVSPIYKNREITQLCILFLLLTPFIFINLKL